VIIGVGPRGLSVLERLLIRLRQVPPAAAVVIWAVEAAEHGSGRIWRTSQDPWLTTNATAAELTMRSPDSPRATGHDGASLADWSAHQATGPRFGPHDYPPRRDYGRYLHHVFEHGRGAGGGVLALPGQHYGHGPATHGQRQGGQQQVRRRAVWRRRPRRDQRNGLVPGDQRVLPGRGNQHGPRPQRVAVPGPPHRQGGRPAQDGRQLTRRAGRQVLHDQDGSGQGYGQRD
jgi:hypothetical protein